MNSFAPVDPSLIDVQLPEDGYPDHLAAEDTRDALMSAVGDGSREMPDSLRIDPKDWADRAHENDVNKSWPMNYLDRHTNQSPTDECTCHSLVKGFEVARNRARGVQYGGPEVGKRLEASAQYGSTWMSAMSVYAEANPRIRGGANCLRVLEIAVKRGIMPDRIQPREYNFKHSLTGTMGKGGINQSSGKWVPLSEFPDGWKDTAKDFRVLEVIFPESVEDLISLVINSYMPNVGRKGHAIGYGQWIPHASGDIKKGLLAYPDSYDIIRYDSWETIRQAVGGASAIATVTSPDDWNKPAG